MQFCDPEIEAIFEAEIRKLREAITPGWNERIEMKLKEHRAKYDADRERLRAMRALARAKTAGKPKEREALAKWADAAGEKLAVEYDIVRITHLLSRLDDEDDGQEDLRKNHTATLEKLTKRAKELATIEPELRRKFDEAGKAPPPADKVVPPPRPGAGPADMRARFGP